MLLRMIVVKKIPSLHVGKTRDIEENGHLDSNQGLQDSLIDTAMSPWSSYNTNPGVTQWLLLWIFLS